MSNHPASPRRRKKIVTLLAFAAFAAFVAVVAWVALPPRQGRQDRQGPPRDADVQTLVLDCGTADEPAGTGMPAWPEGKLRYYSRQRWTDAGELKVEVWEFLSPGHVLVSADHKVRGHRIVIEPRWEVPPGGAVAACHAKFGVEVTLRGLPRGNYVVDAR